MKTALCISGELRRVKLFFPIIEKNILEPYNPDVFVSTWNMVEDLETSRGNTKRNPKELNTLEEVRSWYKPVGLYLPQYDSKIKSFFKSVGNTPTDNLLCMAYHIVRVHALALDRELIAQTNYDLYIRYRFDYGVKIKFEDYDLCKINMPSEHSYGGYQDMFAFGDRDAMTRYSSWFMYMEQLENSHAANNRLPTNQNNVPGMPWHPESSLKRFLDFTQHPVNLINGLDIRYPWCTEIEIREMYD